MEETLDLSFDRLLMMMMKYRVIKSLYAVDDYSTECPTRYRTRNFFNNFTTNEDIAAKFEADLPHCVINVMTS